MRIQPRFWLQAGVGSPEQSNSGNGESAFTESLQPAESSPGGALPDIEGHGRVRVPCGVAANRTTAEVEPDPSMRETSRALWTPLLLSLQTCQLMP